MWNAIITMSSVGYGDYYSTSKLGRLIGVACALSGAILSALAVLSISISLKFNGSEEMSFKLIENLRKKNKLSMRAGKMMVRRFYYNKHKTVDKLTKYNNSYRGFQRTAKNLRIQILNTITPDDRNFMITRSIDTEVYK